jgi:hypothetical protein
VEAGWGVLCAEGQRIGPIEMGCEQALRQSGEVHGVTAEQSADSLYCVQNAADRPFRYGLCVHAADIGRVQRAQLQNYQKPIEQRSTDGLCAHVI